MIKKEACVPGLKVVVNDKVSEFSETKTEKYLYCWPGKHGHRFENAKGATPGTVLIVEQGPKTIEGAKIVLFHVENTTQTLAAWWGNFSKHCDFVSHPDGLTHEEIQVAPKKDPKVFTDKQKSRLPDPGYVLAFYKGGHPSCYCIMNGQVKYIHWMTPTLPNITDNEWSTLLWSCCPTKKQMASPDKGYVYEWFAKHEIMVAAHPELHDIYKVKAPNDY